MSEPAARVGTAKDFSVRRPHVHHAAPSVPRDGSRASGPLPTRNELPFRSATPAHQSLAVTRPRFPGHTDAVRHGGVYTATRRPLADPSTHRQSPERRARPMSARSRSAERAAAPKACPST